MSENADPQEGSQENSEQEGSTEEVDPSAKQDFSADITAALRRAEAQAKASQKRADQLQEQLKAYQSAEQQAKLEAAGEDGKLQVQLEQMARERDAALAAAKLATLRVEYPQAMELLGAEGASLSVEKLAAIQVQLTVETAPPAPIGNNPAREATSTPKEETSEDILARLKKMPNPWRNP